MQTAFYEYLFMDDEMIPVFIFLFLVCTYTIPIELFCRKETIKTKIKKRKVEKRT